MKKKSHYIDLKPGGVYPIGAKAITFTNWFIWKAIVSLMIPMSTRDKLLCHRWWRILLQFTILITHVFINNGWKEFLLLVHRFPTFTEFKGFSDIILLGSRYSVSSRTWQVKMFLDIVFIISYKPKYTTRLLERQ